MNLSQRIPFQQQSKVALCLSGAIFALFTTVLPASAQSSPASTAMVSPNVPAKSWVESAAANEEHVIKTEGVPLRYRVHKVDSKEDITREIIETPDGSVARLVERNGQKLTKEEDDAERERLKQILASPGDFIRHHKRDDSTRNDSLQLVREMPRAMIFSYTPGQPQLPGATRKQIVIDYEPDQKYTPPHMMDKLLTGVEGRMWIDEETRRMVRIEGRITHPVSFAWGVGKIVPGGTIELEQANAAGERWAYSRLNTNLTMTVVWHPIPFNNHMTAYNFQPLPAPLTVQQAVHTLLAMPVPLR